MILARLSVENFRNLLPRELTFSPGINIFAGGNGQGKTNLLESIYTLAIGRSFRTRRMTDLIAFNSAEARVCGEVCSENAHHQFTVKLNPQFKSFEINGSKRDLFEYIGLFNAIFFGSSELEQFRSDAEQRRRFVDRGICQLLPAHLRRIADYSRVVKQKNSLLRDSVSLYNKSTYEVLDVWDIQISELGARIVDARSSHVRNLNEKLACDDRDRFTPENLALKYIAANKVSSAAGLNSIQLQLSKQLKENRSRELHLKRSIVGPHLDYVALEVNETPLHQYASAGQQRSAMLALTLAQMRLYFETHREYPVFLIDDVDAELDENRMNRLLTTPSDNTQVFATTTKPTLISSQCISVPNKLFIVESGKIYEPESVQYF